jgi:hypothetical protein
MVFFCGARAPLCFGKVNLSPPQPHLTEIGLETRWGKAGLHYCPAKNLTAKAVFWP